MKTAMRELIDWMKSKTFMENEVVRTMPHPDKIMEKATELLEEEKKQIVDACNDKILQRDGKKPFRQRTGEEYYHQTYNQKQ